jgi:hypothetical protein
VPALRTSVQRREAVETMSTEAAETTSTRYDASTRQPAAGLTTLPAMEGVTTNT